MKQIIIISLFFFNGIIGAFAQNKTTLIHNGTSTFFTGTTQFTAAYTASVNGDTILLPGSLLTPPTLIDKKLSIIGVGFHPTATMATGITSLPANLNIGQNADSLLLQGISIGGSVIITTNNKVDYLRISRCKMWALNFPGTGTTPSEHVIVSESIVTWEIEMSNAKNSEVNNCIVDGTIFGGSYNSFQNNIVMSNGNYFNTLYGGINNSYFANNIFRRNINSVTGQVYYNTFEKNIFTLTEATFGTNINLNNIFNVPLSTLFVNQTGTVYNVTHDYHLNTPALYIGTNGLQIGIYGGLYPVKDGYIPSLPHIISKIISSTTDANGQLSVQINVSAQNN